MEKQILASIEEEVSRRVNLKIIEILDKVSQTYDIPVEQLMKDSAKIECTFCKGVLKSNKRCLKQPKENGYCGFHQSQAPPPPPPGVLPRDLPLPPPPPPPKQTTLAIFAPVGLVQVYVYVLPEAVKN